MPSFKEFGLSPAMVSNLEQLGFEHPTEIQAKALPQCLARRDVIAMAQTPGGVMWFGTFRGIASYDGKEVTWYATDEQPHTLNE